MGKRFVYSEIEYSKYPSPVELNKEGFEGNELVCIHKVKKRFFDNVLEKYYEQEIYKATFKREIQYGKGKQDKHSRTPKRLPKGYGVELHNV